MAIFFREFVNQPKWAPVNHAFLVGGRTGIVVDAAAVNITLYCISDDRGGIFHIRRCRLSTSVLDDHFADGVSYFFAQSNK